MPRPFLLWFGLVGAGSGGLTLTGPPESSPGFCAALELGGKLAGVGWRFEVGSEWEHASTFPALVRLG